MTRLLKESNLRIKKIMMVHGEEDQSMAFANHLKSQGFQATVPELGKSVQID